MIFVLILWFCVFIDASFFKGKYLVNQIIEAQKQIRELLTLGE